MSQYLLKQFNSGIGINVSLELPQRMSLTNYGGVLIFRNQKEKWDKIFSFVGFDYYIREFEENTHNEICDTVFVEVIENPATILRDLHSKIEIQIDEKVVKIQNECFRNKFSFTAKYCGKNAINVKVDSLFDDVFIPQTFDLFPDQIAMPLKKVLTHLKVEKANLEIKEIFTKGLICLKNSYVYVVDPKKPISWFAFCHYASKAKKYGLKMTFGGLSVDNQNYAAPVKIFACAGQVLSSSTQLLEYLFGAEVCLKNRCIPKQIYFRIKELSCKFGFTINTSKTRILKESI